MPSATPHRTDPLSSFVLDGRGDSRRSPDPLSATDAGDGFPSPATENPPISRPALEGAGMGKDSRSSEVLGRIDDAHLIVEREGVREARSNQQWQQHHLIDLFEQLQTWAAELDARESQLTARSVLDEHRQRKICLGRLRRQSQSVAR